ncbi:MAG: gfo/Idh/MocA family oxidoreductase, partial [Alphaproteobacteria bacterium]|nr:gfo/Idh/MocA family oxidoreductase [Alphaproteobacteria bacterium]
QGEHGTMEIVNYLAPQMGCRFTVSIDGKTREEPTAGDPTYVAQLKELGDVLLRGKPQLITAADSLGNMSAIDAIYAKAGVGRVFD